MGDSQLAVVVDQVKKMIQRVAIETASWMHRQRRRLVDHHDRVVFKQKVNFIRNRGLRRLRQQVFDSIAGPNDRIGLHRLAFVYDPPKLKLFLPVTFFDMAVKFKEHVERFIVIEF